MNMLDFLESRGINIVGSGNKHYREGWINLQYCFNCGDSRGHCGYKIGRYHFNCYKCGYHNLWESFRLLFPGENIKELISQIDIQYSYSGYQKKEKSKKEVKLPGVPLPLNGLQLEYLRRRGFTNIEELQNLWGIQGFPKSNNYKTSLRLFIPIFDEYGVMQSWVLRGIAKNHHPRYILASEDEEGITTKTLLFGSQYRSYWDSVIVVEGVFDVFKIGIGAVGTLGKILTPSQVNKIAMYPRRIICLDWDAQKEAKELCEQLSLYPGETIRIKLDAKDPGSADPEEIMKLRTFLD
jgi:hypothetical protein